MTPAYLNELNPSQKILMGPGPSNVSSRVLHAMTLPMMGHLDPEFFQVMDEVCEMLREVFHTSDPMTMPISATGTGAMETACANIFETEVTGYFPVARICKGIQRNQVLQLR